MKHQLIFYVLNIYCIFVLHFLYSQYYPCGNLLLLVAVSVLLAETAVELDAITVYKQENYTNVHVDWRNSWRELYCD